MIRGADRDLQKIYNSKSNQRDILFRRQWGSFANYMPNFVFHTLQLKGASQSSLLLNKQSKETGRSADFEETYLKTLSKTTFYHE